MKALAVAAVTALSAYALNNGVGLLPELGINTWYMTHSHLTYPNYTWTAGYVLADDVLDIVSHMNASGLLSLYGNYVNMDDCIVVGRDGSGNLIPDPQAFPNGVPALAQALAPYGAKLGWYTDRGNYTCSCWAGGLKRPGSRGHEAQDAAWMVSQQIAYVKTDSCNDDGVNTSGTFEQYGLFRDGLNATGQPVFLALCWGAGLTVASQGRAYGNGWRIDEDDGGGWGPILQNINTDAGLYNYSGCVPGSLGCGFNDPGLLLVGASNLNDVQSRSHFNFWCMLMAKLLISVDPRTFSNTSMETLMNSEMWAIDQDPLKQQAQRLIPPFSAAEAAADRVVLAAAAAQRRAKLAATLPPDAAFALPRSHEFKYRYKVDPSFDFAELMEAVPGSAAWRVQAAGGRPEVWARPLAGGAWALMFFNNGMPAPTDITCDGACWSWMGWGDTQAVAVRDVWAHSSNGTVTGGFTAAGVATNATVVVRLTAA